MCVNRPLVESALFTASAVDGDGNIVCETRTVSYSTLPYGDIGATYPYAGRIINHPLTVPIILVAHK